MQGKLKVEILGARKSRFHEARVARFETRRPDERERARASKRSWLPAGRTASRRYDLVEMREENGVDVIAVDRKLVHRNEGSRAAVDEHVDIRPTR